MKDSERKRVLSLGREELPVGGRASQAEGLTDTKTRVKEQTDPLGDPALSTEWDGGSQEYGCDSHQ